jgi:hypothetical protein
MTFIITEGWSALLNVFEMVILVPETVQFGAVAEILREQLRAAVGSLNVIPLGRVTSILPNYLIACCGWKLIV